MKVPNKSTSQLDRRVIERVPMEGSVTVFFDEQQVIGPGQNMSEEGVFFVAEAALRVRVLIDGSDEWRDGEIVRVQSMGEGNLGMAVRFV